MTALMTFLRAKSGNVAIVFSVSLFPILAAVGGAVDFTRFDRTENHLQNALDAGVLAAAISSDSSDSERKEIGNKAYLANSGSSCTLDASFTISSTEVAGTATCYLTSTFLNLAGIEKLKIEVNSVAATGTKETACVLTLDENDKESMMLNSDSKIDAPDCMIQVNSSNGEALVGNSNGDISAKKICVNGSYKRDGSSNFSPTPEKCDSVDDPLSYLPAPSNATSSCQYTDKSYEGTKTLSPGVYCKKLELNSGAKITFSPGIYIIKNGEFIVNSGSEAYGDGVMFYFTGTNDNPRFNINSGSHIEFKGIKSGTYKGMVFYQSPNVNADFSILNSDSSSIIEGVIYLPATALHLNSDGVISDATPWTAVVVKNLELNSDSTMHINTDYEASDVPLPDGLSGLNSSAQLVYLKQ